MDALNADHPGGAGKYLMSTEVKDSIESTNEEISQVLERFWVS